MLSCGTVYYAVQAKVVLTFESVDEILKSVTIPVKAAEQYFPVVKVYHAVQGGSNF